MWNAVVKTFVNLWETSGLYALFFPQDVKHFLPFGVALLLEVIGAILIIYGLNSLKKNKTAALSLIIGVFTIVVAMPDWKHSIMILISLILLYLGIFKKFEPLLLVPIAFGALLTNLPPGGDVYIISPEFVGILERVSREAHNIVAPTKPLIGDIMYFGVVNEIFPLLIFMGVGAMTDFGPLIAYPISFLLGAAAQIGVYVALFVAVLLGFSVKEAAAIGIIGGADGPTSIYLAVKLAPHLLGPIAVSAYTYMSLVPLIQPPIMKWFTTEEERKVRMEQLRPVSKVEKIVFPIFMTVLTGLLLPSALPLIGFLMFGNLLRETGVTDRLSNTAANELINIVTIFLATSVGMSMKASRFLTIETIQIILLGIVAFSASTMGGVLLGKLLYRLSNGKINPLIGSAGVSAVPMAARVSQVVGQEADPHNFLLMHAMGPNVAGVIGTAVAAGTFIAYFLAH